MFTHIIMSTIREIQNKQKKIESEFFLVWDVKIHFDGTTNEFLFSLPSFSPLSLSLSLSLSFSLSIYMKRKKL